MLSGGAEPRQCAGIEYRLIRKARRRSIAIEIRDGTVTVKASVSTPVQTVESFIVQKKAWIVSKIDAYFERSRRFSEVLEYRAFLLGGRQFAAEYADVKRVVKTCEAFVLPQGCYKNQEKICAVMKTFYKAAAVQALGERLSFYAEAFDLPFGGFRLSNANGKWGSCDAKNNIRLNWRLVLLDQKLCDYVIIHELCHTKHHNHSKNYWNFVEKLLPVYREARKELKNNSAVIGLYR